MSRLRPECRDTWKPPLPNEAVYLMVQKSVGKRRALIHGKLHDGQGGHCAMGLFWQDHPGAVVNRGVIDEIATINDALGPETPPRERWRFVSSWLRLKLKMLAGKVKA